MKQKGPTERDFARWQRRQAVLDFYKGNRETKPSLRKETEHQTK